jgi:hypothetical protein
MFVLTLADGLCCAWFICPILYSEIGTDPSSRQRGRPHQQTRNCQAEKISNGCLTPRQTGRLIVGRNITLTLALEIGNKIRKIGIICFAKPVLTEDLYISAKEIIFNK